MIKGILFDLDGTLVNSRDDLGNSMNRVLQRHHLDSYPMSAYNQFVGNGIKRMVERALNQHTDLIDLCYQEFNEDYAIHCLDDTVAYPGIDDLLEQLDMMSLSLAIVTNKPHIFSLKIADALFKDKIRVIYGEQVSKYPKKPDPTSTFLAIKDLKLTQDECLYIGDSNVDIETAKNAGIKSIGVSWGFRGRNELEKAGATYVVDTPIEIIKIINELNKRN